VAQKDPRTPPAPVSGQAPATHRNPVPARAPDLRARRRLRTQTDIHQAAVALFERQGVRATTVEDIATAAGVSSRTFFRHFATKEQAAFPGQRRMRQAIDSLEVTGSGPAAALRALEEMATEIMVADRQLDLREHQRIQHILMHESDVRALATAQDQELVLLLRDRLMAPDCCGLDLVQARLTAEIGMAVWRSSWDDWTQQAEKGGRQEPTDRYREYRAAVRTILS
jgi:AcrR family transcriptional regulator